MKQGSAIHSTKRRLMALAFGALVLLFVASNLRAECGSAVPNFPATEGEWTPILHEGQALSDPNDGGPASTDILGDGSHTAAYIHSDADFIYFRLCLEGDPSTPDNCDEADSGCDLENFGWMAIFTQELLGDVCLANFASFVDGKGNDESTTEEEVAWVENTDPDGQCTDSNENYETEHCTHAPSTHTQVLPVPGDSPFHHCLAWAQPIVDMQSHGGFDSCNPFRLVFGSGANGRTPNQDDLTDVSDSLICGDAGCFDCMAEGDSDGDGIGDLCDKCRFVADDGTDDNGFLDGDCSCAPFVGGDPACGDACEDLCPEGVPAEGACDGSDADFCQDGSIICDENGASCTDDDTSTVEVCDNGLDDDCDGEVDEGCAILAGCIALPGNTAPVVTFSAPDNSDGNDIVIALSVTDDDLSKIAISATADEGSVTLADDGKTITYTPPTPLPMDFDGAAVVTVLVKDVGTCTEQTFDTTVTLSAAGDSSFGGCSLIR